METKVFVASASVQSHLGVDEQAASINSDREEKLARIKNKLGNSQNYKFNSTTKGPIFLTKISREAVKFVVNELKEEYLANIFATGGLRFVDVGFETQHKFDNVLINIPPVVDNCIKKITRHCCVFPSNPELNGPLNVIFVPEHYCRTFFPVKGVSVFRHFFTKAAMLGSKVVADVEIQIKNNYCDGSKAVNINYRNIRPEEEAKAEYIEKLNTPMGQVKIPGTERFVAIEPIKKKNS
jgi:hypothetical protein